MNIHESFDLVTCLIDMRFFPRDVDSCIQLLRSVVGRIQAKPGCKDCSAARDAAEDCLVRYSEMWDSEPAFERHVKSEEFRRVLVAMDICRDQPRVVLGNLSVLGGMDYLRELREKQGSGIKSGAAFQKHSTMSEAIRAGQTKGDKDARDGAPDRGAKDNAANLTAWLPDAAGAKPSLAKSAPRVLEDGPGLAQTFRRTE